LAFVGRSTERLRFQERTVMLEVALVRLARAGRRPAYREVLLGEPGDLGIGREKFGGLVDRRSLLPDSRSSIHAGGFRYSRRVSAPGGEANIAVS
jgi:hypothetical protein